MLGSQIIRCKDSQELRVFFYAKNQSLKQSVGALLTLRALVLCVLEGDFPEMSAAIIKIGPKQAWEAKGMDQFPWRGEHRYASNKAYAC